MIGLGKSLSSVLQIFPVIFKNFAVMKTLTQMLGKSALLSRGNVENLEVTFVKQTLGKKKDKNTKKNLLKN